MFALGLDTIDDAAVAAILGVVLKHQCDQQRAMGELGVELSYTVYLMATNCICSTRSLAPHRLSFHLVEFGERLASKGFRWVLLRR